MRSFLGSGSQFSHTALAPVMRRVSTTQAERSMNGWRKRIITENPEDYREMIIGSSRSVTVGGEFDVYAAVFSRSCRAMKHTRRQQVITQPMQMMASAIF